MDKQSYFSPKACVRECRIGKGIFAVMPIQAGEVIIDFSTGPGVYLPPKEAARYEKAGSHYIIQVADHRYLVAVNGPEKCDFINHSCEPNCGIRGSVTIVAMRDIEPGEEITFDYMMTESWRWYRLECACGKAACRKVVTGEDWKNEALQRKYKGFFSDYIQKKINRHPIHRALLGVCEKIFRRAEYSAYRLGWVGRRR